MHRVILIGVFLILTSANSFSQTAIYHRYVIEFTDKIDNPYSISNPSAYLSQRAIDRRERYNIAVSESDLPINPNYIQQVAATGVKILNRSKWLNSISIQTDDSIALATIRSFPFVKSSNPVALRRSADSKIQFEKMPPSELREAANPVAYNTGWHQLYMLHGEAMHNQGFRGEGMIIAVFDAGWYNTILLHLFDSLYNDNRVLGTHNFVNGSDTVYDYSTHGTEVLSAMAGNIPNIYVGTAPKASFYLFVTEDAFSESPIEEHNWAAAAEYADSIGADMISSSLGYSDFDDPSFNHTYADMDGKTTMASRAASTAAAKGIIVCNSAGNDAIKPWHYIAAPADADSIITTGAIDSTRTITSFSSFGPSSDGRVKPTVVAQGIGAWVVDPNTYSSNPTFPGNGTSFSNPILAGLVACLWQAHPDKSNMQIIDAIQRSASLYLNPNDSFGYGIPNFQVADLILSERTPEDLNITQPIIYPNPFTDQFGILYYESSVQPIEAQVFDAAGRMLVSFNYTLQAGYNYIPIKLLQQAAKGSYFLRIQFSDHTDVIQVVKALD